MRSGQIIPAAGAAYAFDPTAGEPAPAADGPTRAQPLPREITAIETERCTYPYRPGPLSRGGVMVLSRLDIHRRNRGERTLVTLAGDIGPATTPLLRAALEQCLLDGVTVIDIGLTTVGSCDARGLDVFLSASRRAGRAHASLLLHHPCTQITQLLAVTGSASLLLAAPGGPVPAAVLGDLASTGTRAPEEPARRSDQPVLKETGSAFAG